MIGRAGGLRRWARRSDEQRKADMARVREGIREKYRAKARELHAELMPSLDITDDQIERMAAKLWRADNVLRAAHATRVRMERRAAKNDPWAER
jgi:hypothetical protein